MIKKLVLGIAGPIMMILPLLTSCDSPSGARSARLPDPTLENLWPNADASYWTFAMECRVWYPDPGDAMPPFTLYENEADLPPAPTLDAIEAVLNDHGTGPVTGEQSGSFTLRFDGTLELDEHKTAQRLLHEIHWDTEAARGARGDGGWTGGPRQQEEFLDPLFWNNFSAWLRNDDGIFCYSTFWEGAYWTYLEDELEPGQEFSHVIPVSGLDLVLHGRVLDEVALASPALGHLKGVFRILYVLDWGAQIVTTDSPDIAGYARWVDYGVALYAPGIGPVYCRERRYVEPTDPDLRGWGELTLSLIESSETD